MKPIKLDPTIGEDINDYLASCVGIATARSTVVRGTFNGVPIIVKCSSNLDVIVRYVMQSMY
jgi:hypothetical protein